MVLLIDATLCCNKENSIEERAYEVVFFSYSHDMKYNSSVSFGGSM